MKINILKLSLLPITALLLGACTGSESVEKRFISDCTKGGTPKIICSCTYQKMRMHFNEEQIQELVSSPYAPPKAQEIIFASLAQCVNEHE